MRTACTTYVQSPKGKNTSVHVHSKSCGPTCSARLASSCARRLCVRPRGACPRRPGSAPESARGRGPTHRGGRAHAGTSYIRHQPCPPQGPKVAEREKRYPPPPPHAPHRRTHATPAGLRPSTWAEGPSARPPRGCAMTNRTETTPVTSAGEVEEERGKVAEPDKPRRRAHASPNRCAALMGVPRRVAQ